MTKVFDAADEALYRAARAMAHEDSVEFPLFLANHAPMVLVAMRQMGASGARIQEWYDVYDASHPLPEQPAPVAPITAENWRDHLGDRDREADYRAYFVAEAQRLGIDAVIREYVPQLAPWMAASAIHPLMRMGYALIAEDTDEVGTAIGYWATTALEIPISIEGQSPITDPLDIVAAVPELPGVRDYQVEIDLLWHHIRAVTSSEGFAPLAGRLVMTPACPRRMAELSLALFAGTMDFSALHAVTGFHWLRLMRPHLDDPDALYPILWAIIAALIPKIGFPTLPTADELDEMRKIPVPDWPEIFAKAVASADEHDISLTFSAHEENKVWNDPLYKVVAARRVGLIA